MTADPDPAVVAAPAGSSEAEAVQQVAAAATAWVDALSGFAAAEADRMASGSYGVADLLTCGVRWLRVVADTTARTAGQLPDNLALLAAGSSARPRLPREEELPLHGAPTAGAAFVPTALHGEHRGSDIAASRVTVVPAAATPGLTVVTVRVDGGGVPSDVYVGEVRTADGSARADIRIVVDELGDPYP